MAELLACNALLRLFAQVEWVWSFPDAAVPIWAQVRCAGVNKRALRQPARRRHPRRLPWCTFGDAVTVPRLQESGREGITACALADGSSVACGRCGGVVSAARWQHHSTWCTGR